MSTDPSAKRARKIPNGSLTRAFFVGDTGFEPVTSSVSAKGAAPQKTLLSVSRVRWRTGWYSVARVIGKQIGKHVRAARQAHIAHCTEDQRLLMVVASAPWSHFGSVLLNRISNAVVRE